MAVSPRLELRQSQALVMTPQLQQAIKLLQLSNLELGEFVEQELEKNPLLERAEQESGDGEQHDDEAPAAVALAETPGADIDLGNDAAPGNSAEQLDASFDNVFTNDDASPRSDSGSTGDSGLYPDRGGNTRFDNADWSLEETLADELGLHDHLLRQLHMAVTDPVQRLIGAHLVDLVDEAGYIAFDPAEVARHLGCDVAALDTLLAQLQTFDPTGVFARSLQECLALQLRERDRLDPAMQAMLDHLDLVARRDLTELIRVCGVGAEDIADMLAEVRSLNPKPGLAFAHEITRTVVPDVFVRQAADGTWAIELNSDTLPKVLVNTRYYTEVSNTTHDKMEKAYISDCLNSANWLVKSLDQRANTILKVATELVRQQENFFVLGVQHLRPLNLRIIADAIGMHESTVSRVTANKYMATPRGIFELKYFFTSSIASSSGGEAHSAEAVRHRIRELIESETTGEVLSDDKLVEILVGSGIDIARRTVAKYREAMRIPSSVMRRRMARTRM